MAANGISELATKELRQKAKLALAATDRAADGNARAEYDITQLPTQYYGNTVENNPNVGGLVVGRPWITGTGMKYAQGFYRYTYTGYHGDNPAWFATQTPTASVVDSTLTVAPSTAISYQYLGYFVARTTETYTFYYTADDGGYMWSGPTAVSGFTTGNALIDNGLPHGPTEVSETIDLVAGTYYPIRIQYGNSIGNGILEIAFSTPTITRTNDFTDFIFYNEDTNGL